MAAGPVRRALRRFVRAGIAKVEYDANSSSKVFWINNTRAVMRVRDVRLRVHSAGSDGSAVTATIVKVPDGTALGSGTKVHDSTFDLKGSANANYTNTISTTGNEAVLAPGDALGLSLSGTMTAAEGVFCVDLIPD